MNKYLGDKFDRKISWVSNGCPDFASRLVNDLSGKVLAGGAAPRLGVRAREQNEQDLKK